MRANRHVIHLCGVLVFLCAGIAAHANFSGSDDFSSGTVDSSKWGNDFGQGVGVFTQANGVLEFSTNGAPTSNDQEIHPWIANQGSYTSDWSVQLDVAVPQFTLGPGQEVSMGLAVLNSVDDNDVLSMFFQQDPNGPPGSIFVSGLDSDSASTTFEQRTASEITSGKVMISYSAATHTLTTSYDGGGGWAQLASQDISSGSYNWGMNGSSTFEVAIVGFSTGDFAVSPAGGMNADNFVAIPEPGSTALMALGGASCWLFAWRRIASHRLRNNVAV